jgi:tetrahydromethanopterin S-methyltransferase subunit C
VLGRFVDVPATLTDPSVAASIVFLIISQIGVIERGYFRTRRYEMSTPRDIVASATTEGTLAVVGLIVAIVGGPAGALVNR